MREIFRFSGMGPVDHKSPDNSKLETGKPELERQLRIVYHLAGLEDGGKAHQPRNAGGLNKLEGPAVSCSRGLPLLNVSFQDSRAHFLIMCSSVQSL